MRETRRELLPGVYLTHLQTNKFKTGVLSLYLLTRLDREHAAQNTLIPSVLRRGTVRRPDPEAMQARLDELYGARIEPEVCKKGEIQCLGFRADFLDEAYLPAGESLLEPVAELMGELLLSPNTRGGLLQPGYVLSEKEKLLENIRARADDKQAYSRYRLIDLMCLGEDYAVDVLGDEEEAEGIAYVPLTRHYKALLTSSPIEIFYCGSADADRVAAAVRDALATLPRGELDMDVGTDVRMNAVDAQAREFIEEMDVVQGELAIGYRLGEVMEDPDMAALRVMNGVLGGGADSKLSKNLREKLGLCYFAESNVDLMKGIMTVSCGIDPTNYEKAVAEIGHQLQDVKDGNVSPEELHAAKAAVITDLLTAGDSAGALERFWLDQNLLGLEYGPEELAALVEDVTVEDIAKAATGIECDAVYFLRSEED